VACFVGTYKCILLLILLPYNWTTQNDIVYSVETTTHCHFLLLFQVAVVRMVQRHTSLTSYF